MPLPTPPSLPFTQSNNTPNLITTLQQQNKHLQQIINQYIQQITNLKQINEQHQKQIQNLLKFNQRLLTIIQQEVNNNPNRNIQKSLQPISQVTQVDSESMQQMMQSLQKTRTKLAARSQRGMPYKSQIQFNSITGNNNNASQSLNNYNPQNDTPNRLHHFLPQSKDLQRSQRYVPTVEKQLSQFGNKSSFSKKRQKKKPYYTNDNPNTNINNTTANANNNANNVNNMTMNTSNNNISILQKQKLQFGSRKQLIDHQLSMQELQRASTDARPLVMMDDSDHQQNNEQKQNINNKPNINININTVKNTTNNNKNNEQYSKIQQQITKKMQWEIQQMRKNSHMNHQFLDQKINQLTKLSKQIVYDPQRKFNQLQNKVKLSPHLAAQIKKAMTHKNN